jgi:hypothetical protein
MCWLQIKIKALEKKLIGNAASKEICYFDLYGCSIRSRKAGLSEGDACYS